MATVQFFGVDQVMEAAENLNCPAWAIFISRALFTKYEGSEMTESLQLLQKNLEALSRPGSTAIYTLKFFESETGKAIKLNERTVCDGGSFNFKLVEPAEREAMLIGNSSQYGMIAEMRKEIEELKKQKAAAEALIDDDEPESIGTVLLDLLKKPAELAQLVNIGRAMIGMPVQNMGAIGSVPAIPAIPESKMQQVDRLEKALDTLEKSDPLLIDHLEKLAHMATTNPEQFKGTVSILDLQ